MSEASSSPFSPEQLRAMELARDVLDFIDTTTQDYIIQYDPSEDRHHPNFESIDAYLAENRVALRDWTLQLAEGALDIVLYRWFASAEPQRFGHGEEWDPSFQADPEYAPFRELDVVYAGLAHIGWQKKPEKEEHYSFYHIHQPGKRLHRLGLIIATTVVRTQELYPIDRETDEDGLGEAVQIATQRLFTMAATSEDTEEAEMFEKEAEAAARQGFMISECFASEGGYRLLNPDEVGQLSNTLHSALAYGKEQEN